MMGWVLLGGLAILLIYWMSQGKATAAGWKLPTWEELQAAWKTGAAPQPSKQEPAQRENILVGGITISRQYGAEQTASQMTPFATFDLLPAGTPVTSDTIVGAQIRRPWAGVTGDGLYDQALKTGCLIWSGTGLTGVDNTILVPIEFKDKYDPTKIPWSDWITRGYTVRFITREDIREIASKVDERFLADWLYDRTAAMHASQMYISLAQYQLVGLAYFYSVHGYIPDEYKALYDSLMSDPALKEKWDETIWAAKAAEEKAKIYLEYPAEQPPPPPVETPEERLARQAGAAGVSGYTTPPSGYIMPSGGAGTDVAPIPIRVGSETLTISRTGSPMK